MSYCVKTNDYYKYIINKCTLHIVLTQNSDCKMYYMYQVTHFFPICIKVTVKFNQSKTIINTVK